MGCEEQYYDAEFCCEESFDDYKYSDDCFSGFEYVSKEECCDSDESSSSEEEMDMERERGITIRISSISDDKKKAPKGRRRVKQNEKKEKKHIKRKSVQEIDYQAIINLQESE